MVLSHSIAPDSPAGARRGDAISMEIRHRAAVAFAKLGGIQSEKKSIESFVRVAGSWARRCEYPIRFGDAHQRAETQHLGAEDASTERQQTIIDATFVVVVGDWARLGFLNEAFALELSDMAVEIPGFERDSALRVCDDVLPQPVAVAFSRAQHGQDEELDWFEREELVGVAVAGFVRHSGLG
jgi:hypothetical protein